MVSGDESGRVFGGRYRLLESVGEGSNARVHLAEDLTLRRRVALKILGARLAEDASFLERFAAEMRATSALNHPRVLPVYDWGLDPQPYTATEYLAGGSLAAVLDAGHRLTPSQALVVGLEAARALVNVHAGGRAHLGLSPASILFDSGARPYISDLGLAAAVESVGADAGNADGAAVESVGADAGNADGATHSLCEQAQDVRDLGLLLCEAVTGSADLTVEGSDPARAVVTALGPMQAVLQRATAADPADRLNAADLANELLRIAALMPRPEPLPLAVAAGPATRSAPSFATSTGTFEQVGPTVSERSATPLDDALRRRWPGLVLATLVVMGGTAAGVWAWIASGPHSEAVPELAGLATAAAGTAAQAPGWTVNEILVREPGTRRGEIVHTEPEAGASLEEGATLDVFVSLGEPLILVGDLDVLYGKTVSDATAELEVLGLAVSGERLTDDGVVPAGLVLGVDAGEGVFELEAGSAVDLLVSGGPAPAR